MSETLAIQVMEALARQDRAATMQLATQDATASGGILPGTIPLADAMNVMSALWASLSDFAVEIDSVASQNGETRIDFHWAGHHTNALSLPGSPAIPATGRRVSVADRFIFRFADSRLCAVRVDSPATGGIPGMMAQIGVVAS